MDNELITEKNWLQRNWKWFIPLLGVAIIGILSAVTVINTANDLKSIPDHQAAFDSVKWKTKNNLDYPYRLNMLEDLIKSDTLTGLSQEEIISLLGEPNQAEEVYLFYTITQKRIGNFPVNTKSLVIKPGKNGKKNKLIVNG